jgi:GNAT superfamily N-acetyltransferase
LLASKDLILNYEALKISQSHRVSEGAKRLIWEVFFVSRQRGISLSVHFPWLDDDRQKVTCLTLEKVEGGVTRVCAALVIKHQHIDGLGVVGFVGMVCVAPDHRGHGLSTRLMEGAWDYAKNAKLGALVLWTNQPGVYEKVGFFVDSQDLYGTVKQAMAPTVSREGAIRKDGDIRQQRLRTYGVPPFADEVIEFSDGDVAVTLCKSKSGVTLADWHGDTERLISIIEQVLPDAWQINIRQDAPLLEVLHKHNYRMDLRPGAVRMLRRISLPDAESIPYINILQRI